jgi:NodT family efflux transporter outer membrane factor (OMF) lipoprotein
MISSLPAHWYPRRFFTLMVLITLISTQLHQEGFCFWGKKKVPDPTPTTMQAQVNISDWGAVKYPGDLSPETGILQYLKTFPEQQWWEGLGDPNLNACIEKALKSNPSLLVIDKRIDEAKGMAEMSKAKLLPQIGVGANYLWQQYGLNQFVFPLRGRTFHSFQIPLTFGYEIDFTGKNWKKYQVGKEGIKVAYFDYHNSILQLTTQIAATYVNLVKLEAQMASQHKILEQNQASLRQEEALFAQGQTSLDRVETQKQLVSSAEIELNAFSGNRDIARHQLLVLMGESPGKIDSFTSGVTPTGSLSTLNVPTIPAAGIPSELVIHRPDVAQVETRLKIASLNLTIARREFFPTVQLNAQSGLNAIGINKLFRWTSVNSFLSPNINQPLFTGGTLKGGYRIRKSQYQQMIHHYMETLLQAFLEVENALSALQANTAIYNDVTQQQNASEKIATLEKNRYEQGISSKVQWIPLDIKRLEFQKALDQQKAQLLIDHVTLIKSLGGGFDAEKMTTK